MPGRGRTLWHLMRGQRLRYAGAVAALVAATFAMYLRPLIIRATIDHAIDHQPLRGPSLLTDAIARLGGGDVLARNLWIAAAGIVLCTALSGLFMYLKGRWSAVASESIARQLRDRLYDHIQCLPCRFHDRADTGDLVQRCTSDVETVRMFLALQVTEIGRAVLLLAIGIPIMLWIDARMTLLAFGAIPLIVTFSAVFFLKVKALFQRTDEAEGRMTALLQENLTGIRVVRAFARQDFERRKFARGNAEYRDRWYGLIRTMAYFWSTTDLLSMTQVALVLFFGAWWVGRGELTVGDLYAFLAFVHMFLWPIRRMGQVLADLGKAVVSGGRIKHILDQKPEDADQAPPDGAPPRLRGHIRVEGLRFAHGADGEVLKDICLDVPAGQTLAILGPSGSGKSTLIHLLLRLYDYQEGSIRLDGRELRELDRRQVRSQIGVVMQEPFLYSKTVRENIGLGGTKATDEEIAEAARAACLSASIADFEKGYDTLVGEKGVTLSGGQRQRMALARAILRDPPILILDDALSAVDTDTEGRIIDALRTRRGRATTLVIAHRLSTLAHAERIVVLEDGRVTQCGTHQSLIGQDGLYRRLWQIQGQLQDDLAGELTGAAEAPRT